MSEREVLCTGSSGYGVFCAKCGKWRNSIWNFPIRISSHPCLNCNSSDFEIISPFSVIYYEKYMEVAK